MPQTASSSTQRIPTPQAIPYRPLASGVGRLRGVQSKPFWFTLGGGDESPVHLRTLEKTPLADSGLAYSSVAEWEYSFHHLKNGQEDGAGVKHYGGYPTPPRSRAEAMEAVRRYYLHLREDALAKATPDQRKFFLSVNGHYCYQHYACEWGCDMVGSEVGENINSIQAHIAFTRGAARQYGKPWLMDFSSWYGPSIYDEDPRRTWGDNSGPTHGHSLSLHLRTYYVSYMAGASVVVAEGGWLNCFRSQQPGPDGTLSLSALGRQAARLYRLTRRHPNRGVPYAPVALMLPFDHGIYPGFGPKLAWNAFPYTSGDQRILDALHDFFPGSLGDPDQPERPDRQPGNPAWKDADYMHTEALRLVASPHGDIVDVVLSNANKSTLNSYRAVVLAGDFTPNPDLAQRLARYVAQGGQLLLDTGVLKKGILPPGLSTRLTLPSAGGTVKYPYRRGQIVIFSPSTLGQPTADRSLSRALSQIRRETIPLVVSGRLETLYNRTEDGWIVTLVNNEGVMKTFREAPQVNPAAAQTVTITYRGSGNVRRATLWGADSDESLPSTRIRVRVPPGEVRIVQLHLANGR